MASPVIRICLMLGLVVSVAGCSRVGFERAGPNGGDHDADRDGGLDGTDALASDGTDGAATTLFHYSFDSHRASTVHDVSGQLQDASRPGHKVLTTQARHGPGVDGLTHTIAPAAWLEHLGNSLTLEAWVLIHADAVDRQVVMSNFDEYNTPRVSYEFAVVPGVGIEFLTNHGCDLPTDSFEAATPLEIDTWYHLAVTWDTQEIAFFLDAKQVASAPASFTPCPGRPQVWFGSPASSSDLSFDGLVDEISLADYAKTEAELAQSMTSPPQAHCGDGHLQDTEQCEVGASCCALGSCRYAPDGTACGAGSCQEGRCIDASGRVTNGLLALYTFEEGSGDEVLDRSGVGAALDLQVAQPGAVWGPGWLSLPAPNQVQAQAGADKLGQIVDAQAMTVEAWIAPGTIYDPPDRNAYRLVSLSQTTSDLSFALYEQESSMYGFRARNVTTTSAGYPGHYSPSGLVQLNLPSHVVATVSPTGMRRLYVDGRLVESGRVEGALLFNTPDHTLCLGADTTGDHAWIGRFYLVAIYARHLNAREVGRNFTAGY